MRLTGILKKKKCPSCEHNLHRVPKTLGDRLFLLMTLNILPFRRYKCLHCGWEGLRWNTARVKVSKQSEAPEIDWSLSRTRYKEAEMSTE